MLVIRCSACNVEAPPGGSFCGECGTRLDRPCPACGAINPPQFRFCGQCGTSFADTGVERARPDRSVIASRSASSLVERRQMTIMFADLVGSTALTQSLDPEDLRDLIAAYRHEVTEAIHGHEGSVANYMGDGVLAYFGYPVAHETSAAHAVDAGLSVIRRVEALAHGFTVRFGTAPEVRIGIHTGLTVVGDIESAALRERMSVIGETPNIAARLQQLAAPNTVVIGERTARLVARHFATESLGRRTLKGLGEPIEVFRILGPRPAGPLPLEGAALRIHGRDREMAALRACLSAVRGGAGRIAVIQGDAGLGKSRLVHDLRLCAAAFDHRWIDWTGSPLAANTPFAAVAESLRVELGLDGARADGVGPDAAGLLAGAAKRAGGDGPEVVALLADLLGIETGRPDPTAEWTPARRRRRLMDAVVAHVLAEAARRPTVLAVEDLHWMDPSTREVVDALVERAAGVPLLLVVTHRPDPTLSWPVRDGLATVILEPLSEREMDAMIGDIAASLDLQPDLVRSIALRADGIPLFVEELTRTVVQRGRNEPSRSDVLPDGLRDSLMERLDRLPLGRRAIQAAAVIGRTFAMRDLADLQVVAAGDLAPTLEEAITAGILRPPSMGIDRLYSFRHSLIRDAAYDSLLVRTRREIHLAFARVLERRADDSTAPELMATHFALGGQAAEAARLFVQAGRTAQNDGALREALAHFDAALSELGHAEVDSRAERETDLHIARGTVLLALEGYGSTAVREAYGRAIRLADQLENPDASFAALWGLSSYFNVAGPASLAREISDRTVVTANAIGDPFRLAEAHRRRGLVAFVAGDFAGADSHYRQATDWMEKAEEPDRLIFGTRPRSLLLNNRAWLAWYLGRPEASADADAAVSHARALRDPYALVFALGVAAAVAQHGGDGAGCRDYAAECIALSQAQRFSYWEAWGQVFAGWADATGGDPAGINRLTAGLAAYRATGAAQLELCGTTLLADALCRAGRHDEAEAALRSVDVAAPGAAFYFLAEMQRMGAVAAAGRGDPHEIVAARLAASVATARRQGSPVLETRSHETASALNAPAAGGGPA